jgi:hypothetical protein
VAAIGVAIVVVEAADALPAFIAGTAAFVVLVEEPLRGAFSPAACGPALVVAVCGAAKLSAPAALVEADVCVVVGAAEAPPLASFAGEYSAWDAVLVWGR